MGYAGATYVVQEFCNALFDSLFNILPLASDMDRIEATHVRNEPTRIWDEAAQQRLSELVQLEPVLVQISAAKQLRDRVEHECKRYGETIVSAHRVQETYQRMKTAV
jgi:chlorophyllide a reductase subunit Z